MIGKRSYVGFFRIWSTVLSLFDRLVFLKLIVLKFIFVLSFFFLLYKKNQLSWKVIVLHSIWTYWEWIIQLIHICWSSNHICFLHSSYFIFSWGILHMPVVSRQITGIPHSLSPYETNWIHGECYVVTNYCLYTPQRKPNDAKVQLNKFKEI